MEGVLTGALGRGLAACDLFTVEVLTLAGLKRHLVFFVIERETRRVTSTGIHPQPYGAWMEQLARNLTDPVEGYLRTASHLWVANYYSARNPLRLSSLVILGVVARMFRCATRSSCWCT